VKSSAQVCCCIFALKPPLKLVISLTRYLILTRYSSRSDRRLRDKRCPGRVGTDVYQMCSLVTADVEGRLSLSSRCRLLNRRLPQNYMNSSSCQSHHTSTLAF
jgi:hypothetical protein